jgi:hypothetical protein
MRSKQPAKVTQWQSKQTTILAAGKPRVSLLVQLFQIGQTVHRQLLGIALTGGGEAFNIAGNSLP